MLEGDSRALPQGTTGRADEVSDHRRGRGCDDAYAEGVVTLPVGTRKTLQ
jgi:hypothetical protein